MTESILEVYSVIATGFSIVVSVIAYRSGGPKITVRSRAITVGKSKYLAVEISNNGRGATTVNILGCELSFFYGSSRLKEQFIKPEFEGPPLPFRLEGNSFERWQTSADDIDRTSNLLDPGTSLHMVVKVGGRRGRRIRAKIANVTVYERT